MWKVKWRLRGNGGDSSGFAAGLRSLRECRAKLRSVRSDAERDGQLLVEAYASPTISGGQFVLTAPRFERTQNVGIGR